MDRTIGLNTVHIGIDELLELGIKRIEICLGRQGTYEQRLNKILNEIRIAEREKLNYSIHLPVYLNDWYDHDYLDAFFLDADEEMREISFRLLEENLQGLEALNNEYYVLHFSGIYRDSFDLEGFDERLGDALERTNQLAERYGKKIFLEYFGGNYGFNDIDQWIEEINKYDHLEILTDTGHLYFSSKINGFNFEEGLKKLVDHSAAFHLWTIRGEESYQNSEYYRKYHHVIPRFQQHKDDGWAFDVLDVVTDLKASKKPVIIEATNIYKGHDFFKEGIKEIRDFFWDVESA